ncbi:MAG: DUF4160 domain-containing protein [Kiritimatiellae bacterium]|nr:DUF4160 domain-containing protein [Kiritimatiellia bacterium]
MPRVFDVGPYTVYFWIGEGNPLEPVHVHVTDAVPQPEDTKIWLTKSGGTVVCHNKGKIPANKLKSVRRVIESQYRLIVRKWTERFGQASYYC